MNMRLLRDFAGSLRCWFRATRTEEIMDEKESRFDDKLPATPPPTGLRASNTVETLRPREVNAGYQTPNGETVTLERVLAPEIALQQGVGRVIDDFVRYSEPHVPVVRKTDNPQANIAGVPQAF